MDNVKELLPYVNFVMMIVPSILAVVLASSARNLIGKGWLVAAVVITLVTRPVFSIMHLISNRYGLSIQQSVSWYSVLNLVVVFGTACFVFFLLSNWIVSRMKLDVKNLLFFLFWPNSEIGILDMGVHCVPVRHVGWVCSTCRRRRISKNSYLGDLGGLVHSEHLDFHRCIYKALA